MQHIDVIEIGHLCRLLLLDEPFGALDPAVRQSLRKGLRDIIDRVGITAIFVTHDQVCSLDTRQSFQDARKNRL